MNIQHITHQIATSFGRRAARDGGLEYGIECAAAAYCAAYTSLQASSQEPLTEMCGGVTPSSLSRAQWAAESACMALEAAYDAQHAESA